MTTSKTRNPMLQRAARRLAENLSKELQRPVNYTQALRALSSLGVEFTRASTTQVNEKIDYSSLSPLENKTPIVDGRLKQTHSRGLENRAPAQRPGLHLGFLKDQYETGGPSIYWNLTEASSIAVDSESPYHAHHFVNKILSQLVNGGCPAFSRFPKGAQRVQIWALEGARYTSPNEALASLSVTYPSLFSEWIETEKVLKTSGYLQQLLEELEEEVSNRLMEVRRASLTSPPLIILLDEVMGKGLGEDMSMIADRLERIMENAAVCHIYFIVSHGDLAKELHSRGLKDLVTVNILDSESSKSELKPFNSFLRIDFTMSVSGSDTIRVINNVHIEG